MKMRRLFVLVLSLALLLPTFSANAASASNPTTATAAADLRVTLDRLLGEHALLAMIAMQKGVKGAADFQATAEALGKNTADLTAAIGSVYGADAGKAFNGLWSQHIGFFVDYVVATAKNDEDGRKAALAKLDNYRADFSSFLASANPNLDASQLAAGLQIHVNQLVSAFDSYVKGDYTTTYASFRKAFAHMFGTGAGLSAAIVAQFPDKFNNTSTATPAVELRVALDRLLSEHAALAILAMQKGIDGAPDFQAAAGALGENTADLTAAIQSVYGDAGAKAFNGLWSNHIGFFVDYVVATAKKDEAGKKDALAKLDNYRKDFSTFLATANPNLKADALADGLQMHVNQLVSAFDSYVNKDYATTYASVREAYAHMYMTGDGLSAAIVAQFPDKFKTASASTVVTTLKIGSKQLDVNGKMVSIDVAPFIQNGTTFVSLRSLSEAVGADVTWDNKTRTVGVMVGNDMATFVIGKDSMVFNGETKQIGTKLFIKEGRTQIPLRFIAELLGWKVEWNGNSGSVTLSK